jgi:hypothetical protein
MKTWKKIGLGSLVALSAIQLVTCERTNPPVTADLRAAADVKAVLARACYDCHSNETTWPWYSRVAPVSWLVNRDVSDGRAALNYSEWEALPAEKRSKLKRESGEEVAEGEMPPRLYTPLHSHAVLSRADKQVIEAWARGGVEVPRAGADGEGDGRAHGER